MLLPEMTFTEVRDEFKKDWDSVVECELKYGKVFGGVVKKTSFRQKYPILRLYSAITRERKNKVYVLAKALKRGDWNNPLMKLYMIWDTPQGKYAIMPMDIDKGSFSCLYVISPHCFSRYRERFLKDEEISNEELINRFMRVNFRWFSIPVSEDLCKYSEELKDIPSDKEKRVQITFEGVGFSQQMDNGILLMKTFVAYDMLFPQQAEIILPYKQSMFDGKEDCELFVEKTDYGGKVTFYNR
jgi:hypothetical protein